MRQSPILLVFLAGSLACGPASLDPPPLQIQRPGFPIPTVGVVPCAHPIRRKIALDEPTAIGISARDAIAHVEGQCTAPLRWTSDAEATELSVQIELDPASAVEVTFPVSDTCANKLSIEGSFVLSSADGKLAVQGRGTFTYSAPISDTLGPFEMPAELTFADALQASGAMESYVARIGGACAGEIRRQEVGTAGTTVVGSWTKSGCPLGEAAVDPERSPDLLARVEPLTKAWHDVHLDAAWNSGDRTTLDLDVTVSSAPICQGYYDTLSIPVDVRYGTLDAIVPAHRVPGHVSSSLSGADPALGLVVTEETPCTTQVPAPTYCEGLESAKLNLGVTYPNTPSQRLGRLTIDGPLRGSRSNGGTQRVLTFAATPHGVECLLEYDCAVDEICADGFCRGRTRTRPGWRCAFDTDCGPGNFCRAGVCGTP